MNNKAPFFFNHIFFSFYKHNKDRTYYLIDILLLDNCSYPNSYFKL